MSCIVMLSDMIPLFPHACSRQQVEPDHRIKLMSEEVSPEDKIASLQCILDSTAEELEQQRRLNQALINRNVSFINRDHL